MSEGKILFVEDDAAIRDAVIYALEKEGYTTEWASTVEATLCHLGRKDIDLYLLDVMLPDGLGYDICRKLKRFHNDIPVIFLTACDEEVNVVMGLDIGADDYIVKPFRVGELMSRIHSVLRRYRRVDFPPMTYSFATIKLSPTEGKVYRDGREIYLSALEYKLLLYLARNEGRVVTRGQLLNHIFDISGEYVNDNTLTVYIRRLREKLEDDVGSPRIIRTVRGWGYTIGGTYV